MKKPVIITLIIIAVILIIALAYYFLIYKRSPAAAGPNTPDGTPCTLPNLIRGTSNIGIYKNGICVADSGARMTAVQAQNIINSYAEKDANGRPTIQFNGPLTNPILSKFPNSQLQSLLKNGWWFSLIVSSDPNGEKGTNGFYLLSLYDKRDATNPINTGKSQIVVPANLQPYLII